MSTAPTSPPADPGSRAPVRKIIHVDMDAFYASVEQRDDSALRGRPVAVGSAAARGVVAAASYEARAFGVRSAMPSATALRRCPELVFVRPRFDIYRAVSMQIRAVFAEFTPLIEPLSLDEAYLDVTENRKGMTLATEVARAVRARIREETGLTASAGVSYCKFLAKMASGMNKPDGQAVIRPSQGAAFVAALPVARFHGIGPATARKMAALGIHTGADLRALSPEFLRARFGKAGQWYFDISRGIDNRPVQPDRPRKSIGCEDTFAEDIHDLARASAEVEAMAARVWGLAESRQMRGRTVTLKLRYSDFRTITRSHTLPVAFADEAELREVALTLLARQFPVPLGVRLLGVTLSNLEPADEAEEEVQLSLW